MPGSPRSAIALVLVLLAATACSTTVGPTDVAGRVAAEAAADSAGDGPPADAGDPAPELQEAGPARRFDEPHTFPDGTVVTVSPPRDGGAVPGRQAARTVVVAVTLRNATTAPVSLSSLDVSGSADGADLTATDEAAQPDIDVEPGTTARFDLRFPLPLGRVDTFAVTTTMTRVDEAGNDVPGSDTAPGASVTFEATV